MSSRTIGIRVTGYIGTMSVNLSIEASASDLADFALELVKEGEKRNLGE